MNYFVLGKKVKFGLPKECIHLCKKRKICFLTPRKQLRFLFHFYTHTRQNTPSVIVDNDNNNNKKKHFSILAKRLGVTQRNLRAKFRSPNLTDKREHFLYKKKKKEEIKKENYLPNFLFLLFFCDREPLKKKRR